MDTVMSAAKGIGLFILIVCTIGGLPLLAVIGIEKRKNNNGSPLPGVTKRLLVPLAVSLFVTADILAVIVDRLNHGVWTFSQVGWWSFGIVAAIVLVALLYSVYKEHVQERKMRGW